MLNHGKTNAKSGADFETMANSLITVFSISYLINPSKRYEDVYELLKKSANAYKLENSWEKAGDVYLKAAQYIGSNQSDGLFSVSSNFESVECYTNAAFCYDKIKHPNRFKCRFWAINLHVESGNFDRAGKLAWEIAGVYEQNSELEKAIEHYTKAKNFFELSGKSKSDSVGCLCKLAELELQKPNGNWQNLRETYDKIIDYYQSINLGKYQVKQYIMMVLLIIMVSSPIEKINDEYNHYCSIDYSFPSSSNGKFITGLIDAIANNDAELFATKCFEYDRVKTLDSSMVAILSAIKKQIIGEETSDVFGEFVPGIDDEIDLC